MKDEIGELSKSSVFWLAALWFFNSERADVHGLFYPCWPNKRIPLVENLTLPRMTPKTFNTNVVKRLKGDII